jgi:Protein of unknown function (DUF4054)
LTPPVFAVSGFRAAFPEFGDTTVYPDSLINTWAGLATAMVVQCRWKSQWLLGVYLYIAHEVTLEAQSRATATNGGTPGQNSGVPNQKAVGGVNVSYDSQSNSEKDAGWWNLTTYGKQFYRLARIFGAGAVQLGGGGFRGGFR